MTTLLFTHKSSENHDMGTGHPENPDRVRAVWEALNAPRFNDLERREAPRATIDEISRIHRRDYVELILNSVPSTGLYRIDPDTAMSPSSGEAALTAAGAVIAAIDSVISGEASNAFCAIRPPGHHAEPSRGMGFCLFNNVAIGAAHARQNHGINHVAVVDFDVHHGNGTQAAFWSDPNVMFASSHEYPFYPGTGAQEERGVGNIFNIPLAKMSGSKEFRQGFEKVVFPALQEFSPDLIIISAGFDAHARDPLANIRLQDEDFEWITNKLLDIAGEYADGRIVSSLEGGYDLDALASSVTAHVTALKSSG